MGGRALHLSGGWSVGQRLQPRPEPQPLQDPSPTPQMHGALSPLTRAPDARRTDPSPSKQHHLHPRCTGATLSSAFHLNLPFLAGSLP